MSGLFGGNTPDPPNPLVTAAAQTSTNVGTAVANAFLNNYNQTTPTGSLTYTQGTPFSWTDPTSGVNYQIPQFIANQTLSPNQQQLLNTNEQSQINLANTGQQESRELGSFLGTGFNPAQGNFNPDAYLQANPDVAAAYYRDAQPGETPGQFAARHYQTSGQYEGRSNGGLPAPSAGNASLISNVPGAQTSFGPAGQQQNYLPFTGQQQQTFGEAGDITRSYGPGDFSQDRSKVEEALYQRMDPQLQRDRAALEARLADQGIRIGSEAWNDAMHQFDTKLTDTRLAITAQAGQEQQRMMDMAAQRAGFENSAQMQAFNEARQRGEFANTAQQAAFGQALQGGQFANAAQQQQFAQEQARANFYNTAVAQNLAQQQSVFNAQNAARNQYLQEQYQQRNQPLNEINSLLSGSQVTNPSFVNTAGSQIPTTDIAGLINNRFNQDMSIYQQQNQNFQSLMGGIFGAIGGIGRGGAFNNLTASDRRLKENVERMGTVFAASSKGDIDSDEIKPLPIYRYSFKDDPASTRHIGPMAQDVEKIDPRAVSTRKGIKYINKTKLGSILR